MLTNYGISEALEKRIAALNINLTERKKILENLKNTSETNPMYKTKSKIDQFTLDFEKNYALSREANARKAKEKIMAEQLIINQNICRSENQQEINNNANIGRYTSNFAQNYPLSNNSNQRFVNQDQMVGKFNVNQFSRPYQVERNNINTLNNNIASYNSRMMNLNQINNNRPNTGVQSYNLSNDPNHHIKSEVVINQKKTKKKKMVESQKGGNSQNIKMNSQPYMDREEAEFDVSPSKNDENFHDSNIVMKHASQLFGSNDNNVTMRDVSLNESISGRNRGLDYSKIRIIGKNNDTNYCFQFEDDSSVNFSLRLFDPKELKPGQVYSCKITKFNSINTGQETYICTEI